MRKLTTAAVKRESLMFAGIIFLALISPLFFDQSPINWVSLLFVAIYAAGRVARHATRRIQAPRP
jgi:hypothetical protein